MPYSGGYIPGDRKYLCDICGFPYRFSEMRRGYSKDQSGYAVCPDCFDEEPYKDFKVRPRSEPMKQVK